MKQWKPLLVFILTILTAPFASAMSPAGEWTTIDDVSGKKRSLVRIVISGGTLSGTLIKIFPQPGDTGICSKCPDGFKDKPIKGLKFLWDLKDEGNGTWSGGKILDPKTGKIYRVKLTMEGNKLRVRGYIGISLLGRTQTWVRKQE